MKLNRAKRRLNFAFRHVFFSSQVKHESSGKKLKLVLKQLSYLSINLPSRILAPQNRLCQANNFSNKLLLLKFTLKNRKSASPNSMFLWSLSQVLHLTIQKWSTLEKAADLTQQRKVIGTQLEK